MTASTPRPSILVTYDGEPVALVNPRHTALVGQAADLPPNHPLLRMTTSMATYAKLVARNELPGPYTDPDAEHYARTALIDPQDLRQHAHETDEKLARRFQVPMRQIALARNEMP
ncbi:MAG TPA: hypothetical protein VMF57_13730 [Solirubrobacteraceae bacterium]|jgi:hypothetical protein|nr:hypothetical protein [Solirubrobacteraceae bacterium]